MNQGLHKLVFSKIHHALVVVSDVASSSAGEGRTRARQSAGVLLVLSMLPGPWMVMSAWAADPLPSGIVINNIVNQSTEVLNSSANHITFQQLKPQAIVNYDKLNLDKGQNFNVNMQAGWSMLNRVNSVDPSVLNGNVNAAGNIYFVNSNGIIIGKDAVFNVGSLFAGTLNITNELFQSGFVNDTGYTSVFELVGTVNSEVRVDGGAQINASKGGKVMLFAPNVKVDKGAVIKTPDGQTILAAGKKIYLKSSTDPAGMLVEVASGGTATNLGQIIAERGNITMMGLAVNQMGTLSATTSVRANGSIKLVAQDTAVDSGGDVTGNRNGIITLGTGSVTEVRPDINDKEEMLASQKFVPSKISMEASLVNIDGLVSAKGGEIAVTSIVDAAAGLNSAIAKRIYLGEHATLDVSGVDAIAPMSRFQLTVQLNSDALKDNPVLRGSNLFGKTVYVDARKGTDLFDLQPYIDSTRMATVAEKMTNAGTVTLSNPNEIIMAKGSTINVSGGSTTYTEGRLQESQLLYGGRLVPISQAQVGVAYKGIGDTTTITDSKWGTTETYTLGNLSYRAQSFFEGGNAGKVNFTTPENNAYIDKLVIDGTLLGNIRASQQQILQQHIPTGASLVAVARGLEWVNTADNLVAGFTFDTALGNTGSYIGKIGTGFLAQGFNNINFDVADLTVNSKVTLAPNGKLFLNRAGGTELHLNQNITAAGGEVKLNAGETFINDGVTISVAGRYDNNRIGMPGSKQTRPIAANAGSIKADGILSFGHGVTLDASAGAYVDVSGLLHTGQAGNISFVTNNQLPGDLALRAYGFDKGGELSVEFGQGSATNLYIGSNVAAGGSNFTIDNAFFSQGGFSKFSLGAYNINIGSANNSQTSLIYGVGQSLQMKSGFTNASSADSVFGVTRFTTLPAYARQAVSFDFTTHLAGSDLGVLTVHENAHIMTDPLGSIELYGGKQVNVLGDLTAHGGYINLSINDVDPVLPEDASQMVFVGSQAKLDTSGTVIALPNTSSGIAQNKVVNGGTIDFNYIKDANAALPANIKGAIVVKQGAILDVSGSSAVTKTLTNRGYVTETLYGDAGAINLYGFGSLLVDGTLSGHAAGTGRGGNLNMVFESVLYDGASHINDSGRFWVTNNQEVLTSNIQAGDALKNLSVPVTPTTGQLQRAQISAAQIESGGFDNVRLSSYNQTTVSDPNTRLVLAGDLDLNVAGSLVLQTPVLEVADNGAAQITAGHLQLVSHKGDVDPTLPTGTGSLTLNANQIYIDGLMASSGVNKTTLHAQRDIHGQGQFTKVMGQSVASTAGFSANGELNLIARQVYPDTGAVLNFTATGANSQINVSSSGLAPTKVLSGGGVLNLQADSIVQSGALVAPFGQIHLLAGESIVLADGSLTSVSGNGMIVPYGVTDSAGDVFNPVGGVTQKPVDKEITIEAPNKAVTLSSGATVDLSGGGEMFAYEWIAGGVGGTKDILAEPNTYALIPSMAGEYAGVDRRYTGSSASVANGQTIYINGVAGIPSGTYTLLPARYALIPGAYIVQRSDASLLRGQTTAMQDGSMLTTGYLADMNTGARDAQWSTFRVINGSMLRPAEGTVSKAPSQYIVTNASTFFADPLNTNGVNVKNVLDAGRLLLSARELVLDLNVVAKKITGNDGMEVDINSDNIRVVSENDSTDTTSLQLLASKLNGLNADSILLGGTRSLNNGVTTVNTVASNVSIENDASHALNTIEFLATATGSVSLANGATINTGARAALAKNLNIATSGDGAFYGASSLSNIDYTRTGSSINAASGTLDIAANSHISAGNSLVMDGSQNVSFAGEITLADNASVTLGSNRILLGDVPAGTNGLQVTDHTLTQLDNVSNLTLNSYSTVDTYGDVNFGNDKLNLTINAAGVAGHLADGEVAAPAGHTVTIDAKTVTLKNTVDAVYTVPVDPSGRTLQINAESVRFEGDPSGVMQNNTVASVDKNTIGGYNAVQINAKTLTTAQRGALDLQVNQTQLNVGRITAEGSSNYTVATAGTLTTTQGDTTGLAANTNFGGTLTLQADNLQVDSRIESLAGQVNLKGTSQLHLGSQAVVSAASTTKAFANKTSYIDAGKVQLTSGSNIVVDSGAVVNVSAQGDADAGKVTLAATAGNVQLHGQLDGRANGTGLGGALDVDVGTLPSVVAVDQQAVGFTQSRSYRVRSGDVAIDGSGAQALTAKQVTVSADQGAINVTGAINANSNKSGSIALYAANDLTLHNGATLTANSSQAGAEGGKVTLATAGGSLNLNQGSTIEVSGGAGGNGGSVNLRAPRTGGGSGSGVAVNSLQTSMVGAQSTVLEAFRVYNNITAINSTGGTATSLSFSELATDVTDFMANKGNIVAALGKTADSSFHLRAGQEVRSNSSLNIGTVSANGNGNVDWNLYSGNEPGVLTLRATNNLNVNSSISDGFVDSTVTANIGTGDSWSYRLVAGADMGAANMMNTVASSQDANGNSLTGNIVLANNELIRTGTGDISIAAGGDLRMGGSNAVIYSAGSSLTPVASFTAPAPDQKALYLGKGGDIRIDVQGNITGAEADDRQVINQWLFRQGASDKDTSWWVRPDKFKQSLGSFGGGDVSVNAGRNIANFSISVPTSGHYDTAGANATGNGRVDGGGDLTVTAGGDLFSGIYFVGKGVGIIKAGGNIGMQEDKVKGTLLALMDGRFDVSAGKNLLLEGTVNPTLLPQSKSNEPNSNSGENSQFSTYSETASVHVHALNGDISYKTKVGLSEFPGSMDDLRDSTAGGLVLNPGTLEIEAYNGGISLGEAWLMPAAHGNVNLLAEKDINISRLMMSDANVNAIPNIFKPVYGSTFDGFTLLARLYGGHANTLLHAADQVPAMIVSNSGSVVNFNYGVDDIAISDFDPEKSGRVTSTIISLPKMAYIGAGQDIVGLNVSLQHNRSSDISVLSAGRDINTQNVVIAGPGELLLKAGRNVDLIFPTVSSIEASGNTGTQNLIYDGVGGSRPNTALPSQGSSITIMAGIGAGAKVQDYITRYIDPAGAGPDVLAGNAAALAQYKKETAAYLLAFMQKFTGNDSLTESQAYTQFNAQSDAVKTIFANRHLTTELISSAKGFAKAGNHERGYEALDTLFPTKYAGDILMFNSKVSTNSGGSIDMTAPGGLINVGVPGRGGDDIGIITEKLGQIRAISDGDFSVNQSKVITQLGSDSGESDIAIWSTHGTIDAGRGSKTATSVPQRIVQTDAFGNTLVEVRGVATGSGIRAQSYDLDGPNGPAVEPKKGAVYLTAPRVDAGEAGIEAGDLFVVAPIVLNVGNIQVQGASSGVPTAAGTSVAGLNTGLSPDAVNAAAQAVAQNVANSAATNSLAKPVLPSIISVDVIGIGR
jgi:filamentous hemagglutinin